MLTMGIVHSAMPAGCLEFALPSPADLKTVLSYVENRPL